MGLPYPGGPEVEKLAALGRGGQYDFPVSFPNPSERRFSFSGLKTSLRYTVETLSDSELQERIPDLCRDYQQAVVDQLIRKTGQLLMTDRYRSLGLSGGVSNNLLLRDRFEVLGDQHRMPALLAERRHTGDNAAMIAFTAWLAPHLCQLQGSSSGITLAPSLPVA
jgi:N6-L-threonylcarbamoyladenine synthase